MPPQQQNNTAVAVGFSIAGLMIIGTVFQVVWLYHACLVIAAILMFVVWVHFVRTLYSITYHAPERAKEHLQRTAQPAWTYYLLIVYYGLYAIVLPVAATMILFITLKEIFK
jgi:hypothetical protein